MPLLKEKQDIENWLKEKNIVRYKLMPDKEYGYVVDVNETVMLKGKNLQSIDVKFNKIRGSFDISHNFLQSLEGGPEIVYGSFYCNTNELKDLQFAPWFIEGSFHAACNKLTTLKGFPLNVDGSVIISYNSLTSLEGLPKKLQNVECYENKLNTLKGAPQYIVGFFDCSNNNLTSLEHCPQFIDGDLYANANNIQNLLFFPQKADTIELQDNPLHLGSNGFKISNFKALYEEHRRQLIEHQKNTLEKKIEIQESIQSHKKSKI